jgi:hypothetical protein
LVTDGRPNLTYQSPLVNVSVREQGGERLRRRYFFIDIISTICFVLGAITLVALTGVHNRGPVIVAIIDIVVVVTLISGVISMWSGRKWKPRR